MNWQKIELSDQKEFIQRVTELENEPDYDQLFLNSLLNRRVVLGYYFNNSSQEEENEIDEYNKALKFYYGQDWSRAKSKFNLLKDSYSKRKIYDIYLERIDNYINEPPPESWDGVFVHTTK